MPTYQIDHVLSTGLLRSAIFDDLIRRNAAAAPAGVKVSKSVRPARSAQVHHYHRPNLERRLKPRSVVTVHHDLRETEGWLRMDGFLRRYREAALVHCLNATQAAILAENGITHTRVIPHGVDRAVFPLPVTPRQVSGRLRLGMFSRRYDRGVKGEGLFAALLDHLDPARVSFVLVGEDRWRDAELARARGFAADGYERVPYRLMGEIVAGIDALLILSSFEGGPASLPEALGSGVPVLCTPVGMCPDFIRDGDNGLVLTRDAKGDGARIMALLDGGFATLCDGAFRSAASVPDWQTVMAGWFSLYEAACAS
jgi:glycosyltransferase involved in cell wall biosynthesis